MSCKKIGLVVSAVMTVVVVAGCDKPAKEATGAAAGASSARPTATTTAAASASAEVDPLVPVRDPAKIKKACKAVFTAIADNTRKVAEAEKIGPPAGYIAVGAQYITGSIDVSAKSLSSRDTTVIDTAGKVADEMSALDEAWQKNPSKKPSKAALNKAVAELKAVCAAG